MILLSDTGLSKLTLRKPADASQAPLFSGDIAEPSKYNDLTRFFYRLAPSLLAYLNSRFCFLKFTKPVGEQNLQASDAAASLIQSQFNLPHSFPLLSLTRSVGVSYLSQYLQHLTWTGDILLKYFNHLITFIITKPSHTQLRPTLQILRHTRLATGTNPRPIGTIDRPVASPGNVTYLNCRAVSVNNSRRFNTINCTLYTYSLAPGGLRS
jgi:hypothetical protein